MSREVASAADGAPIPCGRRLLAAGGREDELSGRLGAMQLELE